MIIANTLWGAGSLSIASMKKHSGPYETIMSVISSDNASISGDHIDREYEVLDALEQDNNQPHQ